MTDRERLIELIYCSGRNYDDYVDEQHELGMPPHEDFDSWLADDLLANKVTVQEWISVKDRMPEEDNRVLVWLGVKLYDYTRIDTDRLHNGRWIRWGKDVTHWMPLPNPPKEEAKNALKERVDNG